MASTSLLTVNLVIPTITLNDFQQQFNDLSSQMENAVHNVQKGDQGNPGNGIKAADNQYQLSDSPVTVPTGNWSDNILVTTDQAPYLWTKIIFTYDDGTTKEINFVSSRGDTGSQGPIGPIGPVGPQGKQGNGLVVRGKADKEENLPTIGNNQGDGYLVGTNLYIWIDGSWQNMGSITPDLTDYVKVTDMNNALSTKANTEDVSQQLDKKVNITDMRKPASDVAGIEEVNAKQDAIAYTPADDSKVVHSVDMVNSDVYGLQIISNGSANNLPKGTVFCTNAVTDLPNESDAWTIRTTYTDIWGARRTQIAIADSTNLMFYRTSQSGTSGNYGDWKQLLTADQLPSDLARTGQDTNFIGKLQKSGIDVATTTDVASAVNIATANMVNKKYADTEWTSLIDKPNSCLGYRFYNQSLVLSGKVYLSDNYQANTICSIPSSIVGLIDFPYSATIANSYGFTVGYLYSNMKLEIQATLNDSTASAAILLEPTGSIAVDSTAGNVSTLENLTSYQENIYAVLPLK
uniref:hypothetical protein n=1 Tax=Lentilactobacillus hilgardii TaxID=1588 RepID=UPI00403F6263